MLLLEWSVSQSSLVLDAIIPHPPPPRDTQFQQAGAQCCCLNGCWSPMLLLEWLVSQSSLVLDAIIPPAPPRPSCNRLEPNAVA